MTRKTALWFLVVAVIVLVLGGASVILERKLICHRLTGDGRPSYCQMLWIAE